MDTKLARAKFREADEQFRAKNYAQALVVLDELDKAFPDTKNVLYPRAMCLARVGRFEEALEICRQLKVEFGDPRGEKLMAKISALRKAQIEKENNKDAPRAPAGHAAGPAPNVYTLDSNPPARAEHKNLEFSPVFDPTAESVNPVNAQLDPIELGDGSPVMDMASLDDLFAPKGAPIAPPIKPVEPSSRKGIYIGIGVAAVVLLALAALPFILPKSETSQTAATPAGTETATAPVPDAPEIAWLNSAEEALARANEDGRSVLLFFYSGSTETPEVADMDNYVWSDPSVRGLAKEWVCARIDVDSEPDLQEQFEITTLPTTIVTGYYFDEVDYRHEGGITAQDFYTSILNAGLGPYEEPTLPPMPVIAMVLFPILLVIATTLPLLITLVLFGRMPEQDPVTAVFGVMLVGLVAPILGRRLLFAAYSLEWLELIVYYILFAGHLFVFNLVMTLLLAADIPFFVYLYARIMLWE